MTPKEQEDLDKWCKEFDAILAAMSDEELIQSLIEAGCTSQKKTE